MTFWRAVLTGRAGRPAMNGGASHAASKSPLSKREEDLTLSGNLPVTEPNPFDFSSASPGPQRPQPVAGSPPASKKPRRVAARGQPRQDYPIARPYAPPPVGSPYYKPMPQAGLTPVAPVAPADHYQAAVPPPLPFAPAASPAGSAPADGPRTGLSRYWLEGTILAVVVWLSMTAGWFFFRGPGKNLFAGKKDSNKPADTIVADASGPGEPKKDESAVQRPREVPPSPQPGKTAQTRPPVPRPQGASTPAPKPAPPPPRPEPQPAPMPMPDPPSKKPDPPPMNNTPAITFEKHILPIFQTRCLNCHGSGKRSAGLDLRTVAAMIKGGAGGTSLVPGQPDMSPVWDTIKGDTMPPGKATKLTATQKEIVEKWIRSGAR